MSSYWSKWRRLRADVAIFTDEASRTKNTHGIYHDVETVVSITDSAFLFKSDQSPLSANTEYDLNLNPLVVESFKNYNSDTSEDKLENIGTDESLYVNKCKISKETDELKTDLAFWSTKNNITQSALDELLKLLQKTCPDLPSCSKTVLQTSKFPHLVIDNLYCYFGI
jgi:hypothetical protein